MQSTPAAGRGASRRTGGTSAGEPSHARRVGPAEVRRALSLIDGSMVLMPFIPLVIAVTILADMGWSPTATLATVAFTVAIVLGLPAFVSGIRAAGHGNGAGNEGDAGPGGDAGARGGTAPGEHSHTRHDGGTRGGVRIAGQVEPHGLEIRDAAADAERAPEDEHATQDPASQTPVADGTGLTGLRERVAAVGGRLRTAHTGNGFRLVAEFTGSAPRTGAPAPRGAADRVPDVPDVPGARDADSGAPQPTATDPTATHRQDPT